MLLDMIFDLICGNDYHVMVIVREEDNKIYGIPCEDTIGTCFPVREKKYCLGEGVEEFEFYNEFKKRSDIVIRKCIDKTYSINAIEDSWDGYC